MDDRPTILFNSRTPRWDWLSNFAESPLHLRTSVGDLHFRCVEAAYQCAKLSERTPASVRPFTTMSGREAKAAGKTIAIRADWAEVKLEVMRALLQAKFGQDAALMDALLDTGDAMLYHLSPWDTFWGVHENLRGMNHLGALLMKIRWDEGARREAEHTAFERMTAGID